MDVNADFSKRVMLHSDEIQWEKSPMVGVDRRRLCLLYTSPSPRDRG